MLSSRSITLVLLSITLVLLSIIPSPHMLLSQNYKYRVSAALSV
jgi:hypothetical protein